MDNQQRSASQEVYKQHPEYPVLEVSNFGKVRNSYTKAKRYTNINKQGYPITQLKEKGKVKTLKIHRLVAELFLPPPCTELVKKCSKEHHGKVLVKHLDNDPTNNHVSNLEWSDLRGNTKQAWDDGLIKAVKGQDHCRAILIDDVVHKLCEDYSKGMMPKEAILKYGISRQQATKIRAGYQWKHIWEKYDIKVNRRGERSSTIRKE